jgi:hypothetical protein
MRRIKVFVFATILLFVSEPSALAENDTDFLYDFLSGSYELVGKWPDSNKTYSGKIVLEKDHGHFRVVRHINGKKIAGVGKIETATSDKVKVLRIRFKQDEREYEGTYLIGSDLDNYGRLTGYLYLKNGKTKKPGLEAFFIALDALKK